MLKVYYLSQVSSHKDLQAGVLAAKAGFTYLLCFDNTFSRFRAKTVSYSVIMETGGGSTGEFIIVLSPNTLLN